MNRNEILAMPAGPELDALVAGQVMGRWAVVADYEEPPPYSTDIAAAWEVVEKIRATQQSFELVALWGSAGVCIASFDGGGKVTGRSPVKVKADSAPLAICRAALLSMLEK